MTQSFLIEISNPALNLSSLFGGIESVAKHQAKILPAQRRRDAQLKSFPCATLHFFNGRIDLYSNLTFAKAALASLWDFGLMAMGGLATDVGSLP